MTGAAAPESMSCEISRCMKETGSITHSGPTTLIFLGVRSPLGHRWKSYLIPVSPITVWPAFSPLFTRATTSTFGWRAIASTVLPLPSSPKYAPGTTMHELFSIIGHRTASSVAST